ncbi:MAG: SusC/RagA family TonB-linked outer membrane protein [Sediminibacterium sp.]|nr:SusC/RagA family TonB-linked outer membrane protein [Sediminibacterium sp.]MCA6438387.1 SusC/RagA family TonB-linked outer membrane protein [Chitinophagaceae bacterium]MCA6448210.1 SusC/RagA family TonB-linked outer membrane protein [Chitinophagaceae bacterium]
MRKVIYLTSLLLFFYLAIIAQSNKTISGRITDSKGSGLAGVSVVVKGSTNGTVTNSEGKYTISISPGATTLVFSSLNFESKEVVIGTSTSVSTSLVSKDEDLSEVVVTSFGIKRDKKTLGYSTPIIAGEDLTAVRNTNVTNALVGKVAGVRTQGSGGSFSGSAILIRGYTSMTGASAPLFVLDGVPIDNGGGGVALQNGVTNSNRAVDINPDDIEEMTVLKGAAATSLYGSRGAAGVILITTKKGTRRSKNKVEINSSYQLVNANRFPDFQNEYAQGTSTGAATATTTVGVYNPLASTSWGPRITGQTVTNFFGNTEQLKAYPNNFTDMFKTGFNRQNTVSFSGGADKTSYRVSYNNTKETYILDANELNKNVLSLNLNTELSDKLTLTTFISVSNTQSIRTQQGNQLSNPVFRALFIPRSYDLTNLPYYDAAGNQLFYGGEDNPYWSIQNVRYRDEVSRFIGNLGLRYKFNSWLNADLKFGGDLQTFSSHGFDEIGARGGGNTSANGTGGIIDSKSNLRNINSYLTLNAQKQFGRFNVSGTLGNEIFDNYSNSLSARSLGLAIRGFDQISNATVLNTPSVGTSQIRTVGVFADVVVDYNRWLSLNVKARNDFASTLPNGGRSIFYPAAAVSAVLTEAIPSLKTNWLNLLKVRANYGAVGRGPGAYNTSNYATLGGAADGFGPAINYPFNGLSGYTISNSAGNTKLKPEFTTEWEIGTDINLFNNRVSIQANYYQRKLTDGLFNVPVSPASGVTGLFQNAGEIETKGTELTLGLVPVKVKNFTWSISANYTQFKSVVTKLAPGVSVITLAGFTTPNIRLVEGEEYGAIYGNMYQRDAQGRLILQTTGTNAGLPLPTSGVFKLGNSNPRYTIGITNTFTYRNFTLDVLLDIREGGDLYSRNLADLRRNGVAIETAALPRFDKDNSTPLRNYQFDGVDASGNAVSIPIRADQYWGNAGKYVAAEGFIVNTSWFRIREMNLSVKLSRELIQKTPFSNIEFGVFGRNLFLKTRDYPHLDPEQNALGSSNIQGLEFNANLSTRTLGFNVKFTF